MRQEGTKFYVVSKQRCAVDKCDNIAVALDIMVPNGGRCEKHIPDDWLDELERNTHKIFKSDSSKIKNFSKAPPVKDKRDYLRQDDIDSLINLMGVNGEGKETQS